MMGDNTEKDKRKQIFKFIGILLVTSIIFLGGAAGYKHWQKEDFKSNLEVHAAHVTKTPKLFEPKEQTIDNSIPLSGMLDLQKQAIDQGVNKEIAGTLRIPKISQKLAIYRGANQFTLSLGVATYYYDDAKMGNGNFVLAGHNMLQSGIMFSDLHQLVDGDAMDLVDQNDIYRYRVFRTRTVPKNVTFFNGTPEKGSILDLPEKGEKAKLTLFTCTADGQQRYVVEGHLDEILPNG